MTVASFGCRLNLAEGERIAAFARGVTVINSCAVTADAVRQKRQAVRRAAAGGARVVATGCAAHLDPAGFTALPSVVKVLANGKKMQSHHYPAPTRPQVPPAINRARAARLRAVGVARRATALAAQVGRAQRILVEADGVSGHYEHFLPVRVATAARRGSIVTATAMRVTDSFLECA